MAESVKSMMRQGLISARHANRIGNLGVWAHGPKGTKAHASKMADFMDKSKVDEHVPSEGYIEESHINDKTHQKFGAKVSKGGAVNRGGQPTVKHIDREQGPKFPPGGKAKARKWTHRGMGAPTRPSGPQYGGPSGRP